MRTETVRTALREALREEMLRDDAVFVLGEDVGRYGGAYAVTKGMLEEFGPKRVIDTPLSEAIILGAAVGAAMTGGRPVAEIMYVDFMTLVMDQLVNQAAKFRYMFGYAVPLVVRTQQGIGRGAGAQHSQSLEAWFTHVPGLRVVAPSTPADAKGLLKTAIRDDDPVVFLEHKRLYDRKGELPDEGEELLVPLGSARVRRDGSDVTLIAWSAMVDTALDAAETLAADGISAEVLDLRSLAPLDTEALHASVARTRRAVVVHEAVTTGGFGAEIAARLYEELFHELLSPVVRVATPDVPLPANVRLERMLIPDSDRVVAAVRGLVGEPVGAARW
ncbi:MAG: alpha-ketoacid dehydrogenase subunit beta [Gaiellaceae bacterium]